MFNVYVFEFDIIFSKKFFLVLLQSELFSTKHFDFFYLFLIFLLSEQSFIFITFLLIYSLILFLQE
jgi:hypothetical protein